MTLYHCFNGVIANTFQEIFAVMVLACASAYMSHYEGYIIDDFFYHMLPWRHALASESEQRLFLRLIDQLTCHQGFSIASTNEWTIQHTSSSDLAQEWTHHHTLLKISRWWVLLFTLMFGSRLTLSFRPGVCEHTGTERKKHT